MQQHAESPRAFILERLWGAYTTTDERRRKAFYYLFMSMAAFALVWSSRENAFQLPFVGTHVEFAFALTLSPAFILVLLTRYVYLCSHTLLTYTTYLDIYVKAYETELRELGYEYGVLFNLFKQRDVTETLNCFMFPTRPVKSWDSSIEPRFKFAVLVLANFAIVLTIAVPIAAYWAVVVWVVLKGHPIVGVWLYWPMLAFYIPMGLLLACSPLYFYYRAKPAVQRIRSVYEDEQGRDATAAASV